ncbi:hypothetical protein PMI38_04547 [Pseudomonas sp. GM84]|nr:hypothetical protein PMI38_04547 [Pseudomonas sp. GM84]
MQAGVDLFGKPGIVSRCFMGSPQRLCTIRTLVGTCLIAIEGGGIDFEVINTDVEQIGHQRFELLEQPHVSTSLGNEHMFLMVDVNLDCPSSRLANDVGGKDTAAFHHSAQVGMI